MPRMADRKSMAMRCHLVFLCLTILGACPTAILAEPWERGDGMKVVEKALYKMHKDGKYNLAIGVFRATSLVSGIGDLLDYNFPVTVFAPTDEALFEVGKNLTAMSLGELLDIVSFHGINSFLPKHTAAKAMVGSTYDTFLVAFNGRGIEASLQKKLNGEDGSLRFGRFGAPPEDSATVIDPNLFKFFDTGRGFVIHGIDKVLIPPRRPSPSEGPAAGPSPAGSRVGGPIGAPSSPFGEGPSGLAPSLGKATPGPFNLGPSGHI